MSAWGSIVWMLRSAGFRCRFVLLACLAASGGPGARARAALHRTKENVLVEITLKSTGTHSDPFNQLTVDAVFTDPTGATVRVPAFWAGGRTWKVRYSSPHVGSHTYRTECSDPADSGLHGVTGRVEVARYSGSNPLYRHGPVRVAADRRHLEHTDGTPFFWLGDTWWMGLCHRLHFPDEFHTLAADRIAKGFTVIQIVAGLYPDMGAFDPRGANEAGFPWEADYARMRPEYFDAADKRVEHLVEQGLMPCIVGAWGYFAPWMGAAKLKQHWRYLIARWGALPVAWCVAGEANLPWYLAKNFPSDDREQVHTWTDVLRYVRETDPFRRPVTIHPTAIGRYTARNATDDEALLDFDMLQTPHGRREAAPVTVKAVRESYEASPRMPVIDGEASYEMLSDSLPTRWTRTMFWLCLMNGACGHTYGANGIWQCNRRGQPHGASPHGGNYGVLPWDEAMHLPGSKQVGYGKRLLAQEKWWAFQPHPEWAAYVDPRGASLDRARWIWYPEGEPRIDAPVAHRWFRAAFDVPAGCAVKSARLQFAADDWSAAWLNGEKVGECAGFQAGARVGGLAAKVHAGRNVLAFEAENKPAPVAANPAGLIASLEVELDNGEVVRVASSASWKASREPSPGWEGVAFDDGGWLAAAECGPYGAAPWGKVAEPDPLSGPQCAGIDGEVRFVYAMDPEAVALRRLRPGAPYTLQWFDPLSGATTDLGRFQADAKGEWLCPVPPTVSEDWVLIVRDVASR